MATAPRLAASLRLAQSATSNVVLDLCELEFMDSSGAHVILAADCRARREHGRLIVVRRPGSFERLFSLLGLDRRLELVEQPASVAPPAAVREGAPA